MSAAKRGAPTGIGGRHLGSKSDQIRGGVGYVRRDDAQPKLYIRLGDPLKFITGQSKRLDQLSVCSWWVADGVKWYVTKPQSFWSANGAS